MPVGNRLAYRPSPYRIVSCAPATVLSKAARSDTGLPGLCHSCGQSHDLRCEQNHGCAVPLLAAARQPCLGIVAVSPTLGLR